MPVMREEEDEEEETREAAESTEKEETTEAPAEQKKSKLSSLKIKKVAQPEEKKEEKPAPPAPPKSVRIVKTEQPAPKAPAAWAAPQAQKASAPSKQQAQRQQEPVKKQGGTKSAAPKLKTGIPGMDELLIGGFPEGHVILLSGEAGAGKTLFGMQYAASGAAEYGEKSIFFSFEQDRADIEAQAAVFGWNIEELEASGNFKLVTYSEEGKRAMQMWHDVEEQISGFKPQRVVVDSLTTLTFHLDMMTGVEMLDVMGLSAKEASFMPQGDAVTRKTVMDIMKSLKKSQATTLLIAELPPSGKGGLSRDTVSEYLADGVLTLRYRPESENSFAVVQVRKMRGTMHKRQEFQTALEEGSGVSVLVESLTR